MKPLLLLTLTLTGCSTIQERCQMTTAQQIEQELEKNSKKLLTTKGMKKLEILINGRIKEPEKLRKFILKKPVQRNLPIIMYSIAETGRGYISIVVRFKWVDQKVTPDKVSIIHYPNLMSVLEKVQERTGIPLEVLVIRHSTKLVKEKGEDS